MSIIIETLSGLRKKLGYKLYVLIAILAYTIAFSVAEIMLYQSFRIFTWDLGIFNQAFWNTLHGRFMYYTADIGIYTTTGSLLASHFMPTILLALPFYAVLPTGETLLVISTLVVALGALPLYGIAKTFLKNEKIAAILGISYLFYPALQGTTLSGFSAEAFAATISLLLVYYLVKPDFKMLAIILPLGLFTHEAFIPIVAFIGLYGLVYYRSIRTKGFMASLAIVAVSILFFFFAQNMRVLLGWNGSPSLWHEWAQIGANSPAELPLAMLFNPIGAVSSLASDGITKLVYLAIILLPLLFLPLLGLRGIIPAFPFLFVGLSSSYRLYYSLEGHYTAFIAPFFFLALLHALARLQRKPKYGITVSKLTKSVFIASVVSLIILVPIVYSQYQSFNLNVDHTNQVKNFLMLIPQNASVLTQSDIFPHVSSRPDAYTIAPPIWSSEYERVDKEILQNLTELRIQYVLLDFASESSFASSANLIYADFIAPNAGNYSLIAAKNGVVLFSLKT